MKKEVHYFLTAVLFFTRIPCPKWVDHSADILNKSSRYFSLVGLLVGTITAVAYYTATLLFPVDIAIVISMITSILVTGAFHEDGFADVCDGFGGGWTKDKILTIMKDSRLGTFGVTGLIGILGLKFLLLQHLEKTSFSFVTILVVGHGISRFIATILLYTHAYVRDIDSSKIKPTTKQMSGKSLFISGLFGILPLVFFENAKVALVLPSLFITYLLMGRYFQKWIGGQTGDCAGALQQVAEVVFYISLLALWKLF